MTGYYAVRKRGDEPELLTTSWDECLKVTKGLNRYHRRFDTREEATKFLGFSSDKQALSYSKQTPSKRETARPSKKSKKVKATLDLNSSGSDSSNDDGTPPPTLQKQKRRAPKPRATIDVLSSDSEAATTDTGLGFRPAKSTAITKRAALQRAIDEAASRSPLYPPELVHGSVAHQQQPSVLVTEPTLLSKDPAFRMPPSPTPRALCSSQSGVLCVTAYDHPKWRMMEDDDTPIVTLLRLELRDLIKSIHERKKELNILDVMVSKDLDRPGVLPDNAFEMRQEWVHEGAQLFLLEERAKSTRDLIGNIVCADERKVGMAIYRELQCDVGRLHTQTIACCDKAFRSWQDGQNLARKDESIILNLRDQVRSLHMENVALYDQIQGGDARIGENATLDLTETKGENASSFQMAPNPGPYSRDKLLGYGNSSINWGTHHHELVPDFEAALCQLPMNIPFFNGMFVTYGSIHYHVDDPQLQRALALRDYRPSAHLSIPPETKVKKLKKKGLKKKKTKLAISSSSAETAAPRVRTRETDAEDAQARRSRPRAHDFFGAYEKSKQ